MAKRRTVAWGRCAILVACCAMRGVATGVSLPCGPPTSGQSTPSSCVRTRIPPYAKDGSRKVAVRSGRVTSEWKSARTWKEGAAPAANQKEAPRARRDCVPFRAVPERGQESQWGSCRWSSLDLPYERGGSDGGGEGGSGGAGAGGLPGAVPPAVLLLLEEEDRLLLPGTPPIGLRLPEAGKLVREPFTYSFGEFGCREFDR